MHPSKWLALSALTLVTMSALTPPARADVEVKDPTGRRILLKDDGTWRVLDGTDGSPVAAPAEAAKAQPTAELRLLRRAESPGGCSFEFELNNTLPYEVRSLVPYFAVYRSSDVVYAIESLNFGPVKPGDRIRRALRYGGIACNDVIKLQVQGGDRCEMGDLQKFSEAKGECLARVRVLPSELLAFEK